MGKHARGSVSTRTLALGGAAAALATGLALLASCGGSTQASAARVSKPGCTVTVTFEVTPSGQSSSSWQSTCPSETGRQVRHLERLAGLPQGFHVSSPGGRDAAGCRIVRWHRPGTAPVAPRQPRTAILCGDGSVSLP